MADEERGDDYYETPKKLRDWVGSLSREYMIDVLVQCEIETNAGDNDWYLRSLLTDGCAGYKFYTDVELRDAIDGMFNNNNSVADNKRYIEALVHRARGEKE